MFFISLEWFSRLVEDDALCIPRWNYSLADGPETMAWNSWSKDQTLLEPPKGSQSRDSRCFDDWKSPSTLGMGWCGQLQQRPKHNCDLLWERTWWWNWFYQEVFPTDSLQGGTSNALISTCVCFIYFWDDFPWTCQLCTISLCAKPRRWAVDLKPSGPTWSLSLVCTRAVLWGPCNWSRRRISMYALTHQPLASAGFRRGTIGLGFWLDPFCMYGIMNMIVYIYINILLIISILNSLGFTITNTTQPLRCSFITSTGVWGPYGIYQLL